VKRVGNGVPQFQRCFYMADFERAQASTHTRPLTNLPTKLKTMGVYICFFFDFSWYFLSARFLEPLREMEFA
jgi:hypothetical protein